MSETGPQPNPEEDVNVIKAIHRQEMDDMREAWKQERRSLERLADTDPLTGLANKRALDKALGTAEADPNTAVGVFDANDFGLINKQVSQETGDQALKEVAEAIKAAAATEGVGARVFWREDDDSTSEEEGHDPIYRRGGDEFVVLAPTDIIQRVVETAEENFGLRRYGDVTVSLTGTVGATFEDADALLQAAKAKRKSEGTGNEKPPELPES